MGAESRPLWVEDKRRVPTVYCPEKMQSIWSGFKVRIKLWHWAIPIPSLRAKFWTPYFHWQAGTCLSTTTEVNGNYCSPMAVRHSQTGPKMGASETILNLISQAHPENINRAKDLLHYRNGQADFIWHEEVWHKIQTQIHFRYVWWNQKKDINLGKWTALKPPQQYKPSSILSCLREMNAFRISVNIKDSKVSRVRCFTVNLPHLST